MERRARERWSPLARWSLRVAILGALVTLYGVVLRRYSVIETPAAFALLCGGLSLAFLSLCLGIYAMVVTWMHVLRGFRYGFFATVLSLLVLGPTGVTLVPGLAMPAIHDLSTDLGDPPRFSVALLGRPDWANVITPGKPDGPAAQAQRTFYPDIASLVLEMQPEEGFEFAMRAAVELGWQITASLKPPLPDAEGQIEAIAHTDIVRFDDDVIIRVRPDNGRTRFDVRSVSRFGRSDLGRNAERIRQVLNLIEQFSDE